MDAVVFASFYAQNASLGLGDSVVANSFFFFTLGEERYFVPENYSRRGKKIKLNAHNMGPVSNEHLTDCCALRVNARGTEKKNI